MGSSEYAFSMIVAVFILMLALGAWRLAQGDSRQSLSVNQMIACVVCLLLYRSMDCWPYAAHVLRVLFSNAWPSFYLYHAVVFLVLCIVLAVPIGCIGATMPLIFSVVSSDARSLGARVGVLYAANTIGCIAGALVGGYILLHRFDLDAIFKVCLVAMAATAALSLIDGRYSTPVRGRWCAALVLFVAVTACLHGWDRRYSHSGLFESGKLNLTRF